MKQQIIVFEGIDGIGKTTQLRHASKVLTKLNIDHITTQEFAGDVFRNTCRNLFMHNLNGIQELALISMVRNWHMENVVIPSIIAGKVVLIDRFIESTWAYQHGGRNIPSHLLEFCQNYFWNAPYPDITFFLSGTCKRNQKQDRFEVESEAFFKRVQNIYEQRKQKTWI